MKRIIASLLVMVMIAACLPPQKASAAVEPKLNHSKLTVTAGESQSLKVMNTTQGTQYKWRSGNKKIATVTQKGVVTGVKKGKTTIACKVTERGKTYNLRCSITISNEVVVTTLAQLKKALANQKVAKISFTTQAQKKFTIPKGNYEKKILVVNTPNADLTNWGIFKSITIQAIKENTWIERAVGNKITIRAPKANIIVGKEGNLSSLNLNEKNADISTKINGKLGKLSVSEKITLKLTANGTIGEMILKAPAVVDISGRTKSIPVIVEETAKNASLTTNVPIEASIHAGINLRLEKGAEGTTLYKKDDKVVINIENNTNESVEIITADADKKTVESGNNGGNSGGTETETDHYTLMWQDNFDGNSLDMTNWNYEMRDPGWVNHELQAYTDSTDNIYMEDGKLVIKANRIENGQSTSYTSGKVTTQNKQDFKYGRFEIKAKVPEGQGLWPAIWMMPTNENLYGQWPKCGEIDIMEILGNETNKLYGTIHYGSPHNEKQGTYRLQDGSFSDGYHVYACEWLPGEIRFYVDGILYHKANDWFTKVDGYNEVTFPAPFDQPFYLQLNLAVGGSWPGNPDETTDFDQAKLEVDYVKVYQLDNYDEDVPKPETSITEREPDSYGNYVVNGDFSTAEDLNTGTNWAFLTASGGEASAAINDNVLKVISAAAGSANHSIQIVQPNLPFIKGWNYKLTYEAKASADRTMITDVSAPDRAWIRYLNDATVDLTTEWQNYEHEFHMQNLDDANGRLEFNLGNQGSTADIEIRNVKLEKTEYEEIIDDNTKMTLPDGNHVYNGTFSEGINRLGNWEINNHCDGANVVVTNINNIRELKVRVPNTVSDIEDVIVKQADLAISPNHEYLLSFDARGEEAKTIKIAIDGNEFEAVLSTNSTQYKYILNTGEAIVDNDLKFKLGAAGTTYIDNIRLVENRMILNGDFSNGSSGFNIFTSDPSYATAYVDSLNGENDSMRYVINNAGTADWNIQLTQKNITLEEGKYYKISFDAKSTVDRKIMYALQRDGSIHGDDWTPYSSSSKPNINSEYQRIEEVFQMKEPTDTGVILSISMGKIDEATLGTHSIWIDNIVLEEVREPETPTVSIGTDLIINGDFSSANDNWEVAITEPGAATHSFEDNKAVFSITNPGDEDWRIQLKQAGLIFEKDSNYKVEITLVSTETRTVRFACMSTTYDWYGGGDIDLEAGIDKTYETEFLMSQDTNPFTDFVLSMGKIGDVTAPSTITISNIKITKIS